jgi:hypothetical protein
MPTRRKGYYSIMRARTNINRLSLALTIESSIHRSLNNYLGYPRCRLSVVKHRQLARQVYLRVMDLWGGWQRQAPSPSPWRFSSPWRPHYFDNYDRSTHRKISVARDVWSNSEFMTNRFRLKLRLRIWDGVLSEFFLWCTVFFPAMTPQHGLNLSRIQLGIPSEFLQEARSFTTWTQQRGYILPSTTPRINQSNGRVSLTGAQEGLILTITSQDYIVH